MGIDAITWIKMVRQLPLSRSEREVARRFEEDPSGRQFLPLSDLLRNHKLLDESLELLVQGVQDHPGFAIARVVMARELFQRGQIVDAWTALDRAPTPLTDNVLAQKLKYKIGILLGDEGSARSAFQNLRIQQGIDPEIKRIADQLEIDGIVTTRESYRHELGRRGIEIRLPEMVDSKSSPSRPASEESKDSVRAKGKRFVLEYELDEATRRHVEKFHVVPLAEVFVADTPVDGKVNINGQIELDSTTLAEIYAKQGFYSKSLAIYRRLLRMAPHNDLIRLKVSEMARLDKEQRNEDLESDPVVYDRMEVVEIIDRQMRFMGDLLARLDQP